MWGQQVLKYAYTIQPLTAAARGSLESCIYSHWRSQWFLLWSDNDSNQAYDNIIMISAYLLSKIYGKYLNNYKLISNYYWILSDIIVQLTSLTLKRGSSFLSKSFHWGTNSLQDSCWYMGTIYELPMLGDCTPQPPPTQVPLQHCAQHSLSASCDLPPSQSPLFPCCIPHPA